MSNPLLTTPIGANPNTNGQTELTEAQRATIKAQRLASLKQRVATQARRALEEYDRANKIGIALVHEDPFFTPAEGLAALGDTAIPVCLGSRAATEHIAAQAQAAGTTSIPPTFSPAAEAALAALFTPPA